MSQPRSLDFEEASYEAERIHPNAKAVLNNGKWVFVILTDYTEKLDFPDELKNTPAWEAYQTLSKDDSNGLYDWATENDHEGLPLLLLIKIYNLEANKENLVNSIHRDLLIKAGIPLTKKEIFASQDSVRNASAWLEYLNQAHLEAEELTETEIDKIYGIV
jgi:hypothetical protein